MSKVCNQCLKLKPDEEFRKYTPRGKFPAEAIVGRQNVCFTCEAINSGANGAMRAKRRNLTLIEDYAKYYRLIPGKLPAIGLRILGIEAPNKVSLLQQELASLSDTATPTNNETELFMIALRNRSFESIDVAEARLKALETQLHSEGLIEEAKTLMDDWWME